MYLDNSVTGLHKDFNKHLLQSKLERQFKITEIRLIYLFIFKIWPFYLSLTKKKKSLATDLYIRVKQNNKDGSKFH